MPFNDEFNLRRRPVLTFWTNDEIQRIHLASLEILEHTGMEFYCPEVVEMLVGAGATAVSDKRVKIRPHLVEEALRTVNKHVVISNRSGERIMPLEPYYCYYGPGSETPYTMDPYSGKRRSCVAEDVIRAARVVDALPNIDFGMSFALASDVPKGSEDTQHFANMVLNTEKPLLFTSWDLKGIQAIYDIACTVAGSEAAFQANPFICHYVEPITPLRHPKESLDKLRFSVEKGIPMMYVPVSSAGGTSPVTFAASFAVTNAEFLAGLVISQLVKKGSTFIYGGGPNPLDMKTAVLPYASPETFMSRCIRAEIARYYGLPVFSTGGTTDAKILDAQAGYEAGLGLVLASLCGCNFIHDVGYMEMGFTSSLVLLTMCDEYIGMIKRILRNFGINRNTLALDVIDKAGPGGNFLQSKHTFDNFRQEIWISSLLDRNLYDNWEKQGGKDMPARAREKVIDIIEKHESVQLSESVQKDVLTLVKEIDRRRADG